MAVAAIKDHKKRGETKERVKGFSQKARYAGPTSKLTLHVRESAKDKFKVYALLEKKGSEKKEKGMVSEHKTQDEAVKKFDELAGQCMKAGWKLATKVTKSSFDAIPTAE